MSAIGCCFKSVLQNSLITQSSTQWLLNNSLRVLGGYSTQFRYGRRTSKPHFLWGPRKRSFINEDLTKYNKDFLKDYVAEQFPGGVIAGGSPLKEPPWPKGKWEPKSRRTGVIARKIGIYPMWTKDGRRILSTVLQVLDNHVISYTPPEEYAKRTFGKKFKGKYACLVVGAEAANPLIFTASYNGLFTAAGVQTKRKLTRFLITPNAAIQPGTPLNAMHFKVGQYVDVLGKTVGHGFQGVMKRWGFKGGPATHGCTKSHRRPGCIGAGRTGKVWKGKKMPGHMGQERRFLRGAKILRINVKHNVIYVRGPAIPGHVHAYVSIFDSVLPHRKMDEDKLPFPTFYADDIKEQLPEEYYDESLHVFSDPTITFPEDVKPKSVSKTTAKIASR